MKSQTPQRHAVIIVNYNGWQDTIACLKSVEKSNNTPHIIVVDNASTDGSVEKIKSKYQNIELIVSKKNLGFSGGNNLGIRSALKQGADVVYLLNNDTTVEPNLFDRAYNHVAGQMMIAGAKIYYAKGYEFHAKQKNLGNVLWYAGGKINWQMSIASHYGVDEQDHGQYDQFKDVDFISGCFMAISKEVINSIGLLEESYFLYLEDADYTLRALKNGVKTRYFPDLVVYHKNSSSTSAGSALVDYYLTRNRFALASRYGSWRLKLALLKEALTRNIGSPIRRLAFLDYISGRMGNQNEKVARLQASLG